MTKDAIGESEDVRRLLVTLVKSVQPQWHAGYAQQIRMPHGTGWRVIDRLAGSFIVDGELTIEFDDQPTLHVPSGCSWTVPPGIRHRATLVSPGQACSTWSHLTFRVLAAIDLTQILRPPLLYTGKRAERMGALNLAMSRLGADPRRSVQDQVRFQALQFEFLDLIMEQATPVERARFLPDLLRLGPALDRIAADLAGDLSVPALARTIGLAPVQFTRCFKRALGCTPMAYVQRRRLEATRLLLLQSSGQIHEIAERCGFHDQFHFSRAFKRAFGASPRAYRDQGPASEI